MGSLPKLSVIKGVNRDFRNRSLNRIFEENLSKYQNETALIFHDEFSENFQNEKRITYQDLNESSNRLARTILEKADANKATQNSDRDWIIAVCLNPSDKLIKILLAILKSGAAYLPLDPTFPVSRIQHICGEAKPFLVICEDDMDLNIFGNVTLAVTVGQFLHDGKNYLPTNLNEDEILVGSNDKLGLVLYTSGSTGVPKGVRLPHSIVLNRLHWQWTQFPYSKTEGVAVFKTALTFVDSVSEIWGPLLSGLALLIIKKDITKNPEQLVLTLEKYRIERIVVVPTLLRALLMYLSLNHKKKFLYNLKSWICSGETLLVSLANEFFDYFNEGEHILCNFYGSTEVMGDVTYFVCESKKQLLSYEKVPIGNPIANTIIYLLDTEFQPVKPGDVGEIFAAGLNLASGYVNGRDPERFIENPLALDTNYSKLYRTGDYGSLNKGVIIYEGRTDSQIKIRGHRVDLSEIEKTILSLEFIDRVVVLSYHAGEIDQTLLSFVTLKSPVQTGLQIEQLLLERLPAYMIPQVKVVDTIPLLVNGKVDRQALLKLYENTNNNDDSAVSLDYDYTGISGKILNVAKDLFEIIGNVIGRSTRATLSKASNFYKLGGNSLNSIFTVTQLRDKGYFISITDFIKAATLGEILDKIVSNSQQNNKTLIEEASFDDMLDMRAVPLKMEHKIDAIDIITKSFYNKADLEQWLKPDIIAKDYSELMEAIWEPLVEKELSFIILNKENEIIAVALNFDARDEPMVEVKSKLNIIFDFLEHLEGPIRDGQLPKGIGKILHSFMMGTREDLGAQENITIMNFMESEVLKLAQKRKFAGILTTNTSPLTQQLGTDVYKYKILLDYQVNEYVHNDGKKPFSAAPSSQRAIVHWKDIRVGMQ